MSDISDDAGHEFDEEFGKHGYLAEPMRHMQAHIRKKYSESFEIAEALNSLAQKLYLDSTQLLPGRNSLDPLCVAIQIIPRALSAYQGTLLIAERGMHIEALTLARSIYETAFWLGYLHNKPIIARDTLFFLTLRQELEVHRLSLETAKDRLDVLTSIKERMADLGRELKKLPKRTIEVADLARDGGFGDSYAQYKALCGKAAHVSLQSTIHYLNRQDDGSFNGHIIGPDENEVLDALIYACAAIIMVIEAMRWLTKDTSHDEVFQALMGRYAKTIMMDDDWPN